MLTASKYAQAEKELKPAQVYGRASLALYENADVKVPANKKKHPQMEGFADYPFLDC